MSRKMTTKQVKANVPAAIAIHGMYMIGQLEKAGVNTAFLGTHEAHPSPIVPSHEQRLHSAPGFKPTHSF